MYVLHSSGKLNVNLTLCSIQHPYRPSLRARLKNSVGALGAGDFWMFR